MLPSANVMMSGDDPLMLMGPMFHPDGRVTLPDVSVTPASERVPDELPMVTLPTVNLLPENE